VLTGQGTVNPMPLLMRSIRLRGIFVGSRTMFTEMNRAIETAKMRPVIDRTFAFSEFPDALRHMQAARHFGKIVVTV